MDELLKQTYKVAEEIKTSDEYQRLFFLSELIKKKYIKEIEKLKINQGKYERFIALRDTYSDGYKKTLDEFRISKIALYEKEEVIEYLKLEGIIQTNLNELSRHLGEVVSKNILVPNEIGIIKHMEKNHGK